MSRPCRSAGFTLVELMVAVALFAVLASLAYPGLTRILAHRSALDATQSRFGLIAVGAAVLTRDIEHAAPRPVRGELGEDIAALRGGIDGVLFECTRRIAPLTGFDNGSGLARVEYLLRDAGLVRRTWDVLDRSPASTYSERVVFEDVRSATFAYFDGESWTEFWPPRATTLDLARLPEGVRAVLEFGDGTQLTRVVALAEFHAGG
jgi:general secretion pathway protein J